MFFSVQWVFIRSCETRIFVPLQVFRRPNLLFVQLFRLHKAVHVVFGSFLAKESVIRFPALKRTWRAHIGKTKVEEKDGGFVNQKSLSSANHLLMFFFFCQLPTLHFSGRTSWSKPKIRNWKWAPSSGRTVLGATGFLAYRSFRKERKKGLKNKQQTTNNEQRTTNNQQQTTNNNHNNNS